MEEYEEMVDPILICLYCGDIMEHPGKSKISFFDGPPSCCNKRMVTLERNDLFKVAEGLDNLKQKVNEEIIRGLI